MEIYNSSFSFKRNTILIVMVFIILIPYFSMADSNLNNDLRVYQMGIMTQNPAASKNYISRAEIATIAVRLTNLEHLKASQGNATPFKDVSGWALPYVNIANNKGLMKGVNINTFNPSGNITYGEILTVIMRVLEYKDGIDFKIYPDDYYSKAIEIGLASLYIPYNQLVTREIVAETINKALDLKVKNKETLLVNMIISNPIKAQPTVPAAPTVDTKISLNDLNFNSSIYGTFSGLLKATNPENYKVVLLSGSGDILRSTAVNSNGSFSIDDFDIGILTKIQGYKYEVHSLDGNLILSGNLN